MWLDDNEEYRNYINSVDKAASETGNTDSNLERQNLDKVLSNSILWYRKKSSFMKGRFGR